MKDISKIKSVIQPKFVSVPKDYITSPIFASGRQTGPRIVQLKKKAKNYEIGGFSPMARSNTKPTCPALDIRHGRAIFTILTFYDELNSNDKLYKINFSLNQFIKRYVNSNGGSYSKYIQDLLDDLLHCWFRVTYSNGEKKTYRILKDVVIRSKPKRFKKLLQNEEPYQEELWLDEVELHPEFYNLLSDYSELGLINLEVLNSISSPLAQAIYTYLPSRVIDREEGNAFEIGLITILNEVSHPVPAQKCRRKQLFTQNEKSIINQLDGLPFAQGGVLRVKLVETADDSDYKLLFWNDNVRKKASQRVLDEVCPILRNYWLKSGRTNDAFNQRIQRPVDLQAYQKEVLERAKVKVEGNESFMKAAIALLGESKFNELASEVKAMVLEPGFLVKNPTKIFIHVVCKSLSKAI